MSQVNRLREIVEPGDVLLTASYLENSHSDVPLLDQAIHGIRGHQIRRYPKSPLLYQLLTHAMLYCDDEHILNVTWPKAKWSTIDDIVAEDNHLLVARYKHRSWTTIEAAAMAGFGEFFVGYHYDPVDLIQFIICEKFGYDNPVSDLITRLVGIGAHNAFCSFGTITPPAKMCKLLGLARPVQCLLELTAPATFLCPEEGMAADQLNFDKVYEYRPDNVPQWVYDGWMPEDQWKAAMRIKI